MQFNSPLFLSSFINPAASCLVRTSKYDRAVRNPEKLPTDRASAASCAISDVVSHLRLSPRSIDIAWSPIASSASCTSLETSRSTWSSAATGHSGCNPVEETKGNSLPSSRTWVCGFMILKVPCRFGLGSRMLSVKVLGYNSISIKSWPKFQIMRTR